MILPPWQQEDRDWQREARDKFFTSTERAFLLAAHPGTGKTYFGTRNSYELLASDAIKQIVVVAPTVTVCRQWVNDFAKVGIQLSDMWSGSHGEFNEEYNGVVITYQSLGMCHLVLRGLAGQKPTQFIFDEIHHLGSDRTWAKGAETAAETAAHILNLTGTPWRSDGKRIPFVNYETVEGGVRCKPNHTYGYGDGLRDRILRPLYFPTYEGGARFLDRDDEIKDWNLSDKLTPEEVNQLHRHVLWAQGDWAKQVIEDAYDRLLDIRDQNPTAAILIVTDSINDCMAWAKRVVELTKQIPTVVHSDDPDSRARLQLAAEGKGDESFFVSCKMITEGVDIKRLQIVIYATTLKTELIFDQIAGRVLRVTGEDEYSLMYLPRVQTLVRLANKYRKARDLVIEERQRIGPPPPPPPPREFYSTITLDTRGSEAETIVGDGDAYLFDEKAAARKFLVEVQAEGAFNEETGVRILRHVQALYASPPNVAAAAPAPTTPRVDQIKKRRKEIRRLEARVCYRLNLIPGTFHREWVVLGHPRHEKLTMVQLDEKERWLLDKLNK